MSHNTAPAREKRGSWVWWLLGLAAASLLVIAGGAVLLSFFVARHVQVTRSGEDVQIHTPVGGMRVAKGTTLDPGLPVYPQAQLVDPAALVELLVGTDDHVSIVAARYRTSDPLDVVDAWYREKLGPEFVREGPGETTRKRDVVGVQVKSDDIAFISEKDDRVMVVALERKRDAVEIALVRVGQQEPL